MKPIFLAMQAFGPFADREVVDFARLPEGALYLISGPTGAGKTSILDGICFALYGESSGTERTASGMRSDHAAPNVQTEVTLQFALGEKHFRVTRSPAQERPAKRGSGVTVEPAKAELFDLTRPTPELLTTGADKVTHQIKALIGFDMTQFRQVVVLPQGQFRQLLSAATPEREAILKALFGTGIYQRVQDELKARAAQLATQAQEVRSGRDVLLRAAEATSVEDLEARLATLAAERAGAQDGRVQAEAQERQAEAALAAARAEDAKFVEQREARAQLDALEAQQDAFAAEDARLQGGQRAERAMPAWIARTKAHATLETVQGEWRRAQEALDEAGRVAATRRAALDLETAREPERVQQHTTLAQLRHVANRVVQLTEVAGVAEAARQRHERLAASVNEAEAALRKAQEAQALREAEVQTLAPIAAAVEARRAQLQQAQRLAQLQKEVARLQVAAQQAREAQGRASAQWETQQNAWQSAQQQLTELENRWRDGQAALLAQHLHDGQPCPVCGSETHPQKAAQAQAVPTDAQVEAARAALTRVESVRQERADARAAASQAAAVADAAWRAAAARLAEEAPEAPVDLDAAMRAVAAAEAAQTAWAAAREASQQAALLAQNCVADLEPLRELVVEAAGTAAQAAGQLAAMRADVPEDLRAPGAVERAVDAAERALLAAQRALQAAQASQSAAEVELAKATERFAGRTAAREEAVAARAAADGDWLAALVSAGLADTDAFLAARMEGAALRALEARVQQRAEQFVNARGRLQRADAAIQGLQQPALAVLEEALLAARGVADALLRKLEDLKARVQQTDDALRHLAAIATQLAELDAQYAVTGTLSQVANDKRMTFQRFVLTTLLDEVLAAASQRLLTMTRNRYELVRRQDAADARRAAGLDLDVRDEYTGRMRPAHSLSGGEGFMASLSLALGLSDVVQRHAGGIQLDALFIDEGFGSLDSEALELAIDTLTGLRAGGRSVGIISHVDELKQQIRAGIRVEAGLKGSTIRVLGDA